MNKYSRESPIASAKVVADSLCGETRLTTLEVKFPRRILDEFNTHRKFSRNSASNRAVPIKKMLLSAREDPATPLAFYEAQAGMVGGQEIVDEPRRGQLYWDWYSARDFIADMVERWLDKGVHKTEANDMLMPYVFHTAIVSSTEWNNFFSQRISPAARPEMNFLAQEMWLAISGSTPTALSPGQWHIPYRNVWEDNHLDPNELLRVSVARCARVSYLTHDGQRDISKDFELYLRLLMDKHWSPFEHIAQASQINEPALTGNFDYFRQLRHLLSNKVMEI